MKPIFIVAARRTPQGRLLGGLNGLSAVDLAIAAGRGMLSDRYAPDAFDAVILGNVLSAGAGMNIGRQVGVGLGLPIDKTGVTVNMMCASGMYSLFQAVQALECGQNTAVICGGTESMTAAPYLAKEARTGYRLGNGALIDSVVCDGLTDPFSGRHMGLTAEALAQEYGIGRDEQDAYALRSQQRCRDAVRRGALRDEIIPAGKLDKDEHPRPETTLGQLAQLKPVFAADGTVTAGNSSGVNDGAAMLVVCDEKTAARNQWRPMARITGYVAVGCDPARMGLGPVHAVRLLCERYRLKAGDFDTVELNEAFAAQVLACIRELKLNPDLINPDGGSIALGHPIGATGARLVVHLAHRIARGETKRGLATLCVGGGMGAALALESV